MPDFNLPGLLHTLDAFSQFEVDTIIFAHNGNYLDPLETGDQDTVRFQIQYITDIQDRASNEGYPKVSEDFSITEKTPTRAFSWFALNLLALSHLRHYAKIAKRTLTPSHGK